MHSWYARLRQELDRADQTPVVVVGCSDRHSVTALAGRARDLLQHRARWTHLAPRDVIPILEAQTYPPGDAQWRQDTERDLENERKDQAQDVCWLLGYAKDHERWHELLPDCASTDVPIKVRLATRENLLEPLRLISSSGEYQTTGGPFRVRLLFFDVNSELLDEFAPWCDDSHTARLPRRVEIESERWNMYAGSTPPFTDDERWVRKILLQRAIGSLVSLNDTAPCEVTVAGEAKQGEVVFLDLRFNDGSARQALYWAKFGSIHAIETERRNVLALRGACPDLRPYLYEIPAVASLPADYAAVTLSCHVSRTDARPITLEDCLHTQQAQKLETVFRSLDRFLRPFHETGSDRPHFSQTQVKRYETLLRTRSAKHTDTKCPVALLDPAAASDDDVPMKLTKVRSRRRGQIGELTLWDRRRQCTVVVRWEREGWRWRLWRVGIEEGDTVTLVKGAVSLQPQRRGPEHLENAVKQYGQPLAALASALRERLTPDGEIVSKRLLGQDLYPVWLHGDFHARNVILSNSSADEFTVIDLAEAVRASKADAVRAPMAFDYVTFEVDAKASCFCKNGDAPTFIEAERKAWKWCRDELPAAWGLRGRFKREWTPPPVPDMGVDGYDKIALWRHFALHRLVRVAHTYGGAPKSWRAADSYAQALLYHSFAFLEYLDPKNPREVQKADTCLAGCAVALEQLEASARGE